MFSGNDSQAYKPGAAAHPLSQAKTSFLRQTINFWGWRPAAKKENIVFMKPTRKLSYRKDDHAMCPMYGCPENF